MNNAPVIPEATVSFPSTFQPGEIIISLTVIEPVPFEQERTHIWQQAQEPTHQE